MVYPGSKKYIRKIVFGWIYRYIPILQISPIGFIIRPGMIGVYASTKELLAEADHCRLKEITQEIPTTLPYARSVSLAGSWPSWLNKAGISTTTSPLVNATLGTVYTTDKVCQEMVHKRNFDPNETILGIIGGGGFVGRVFGPQN